MPSIARIDRAIQRGRGKSARVFGQSFDVYRLNSRTDPTGIVGPGSLIASAVRGEFERETSRANLETETPTKTLFYSGSIDMTPFAEGDVFVQRADSYKFERLVLTCVSNRPAPRHSLFASSPIFATLTRPAANPNHVTSGRAPISAPIKDYELPLTLEAGSYAFAPSFAAAAEALPVTVPVGMTLDKGRDYPRSESSAIALLDDVRRQTWHVFVPLLPGESLQARDVITGANGDRFSVTASMPVYSAFFGQLVLTERRRD